MEINKRDLVEIKETITQPWSPVDVADIDEYVLRAAIFEGEYHWHRHENEDELFLVYDGSVLIETDEGNVHLDEGECVVIPRRLRHRPSAENPAFVLMLEAKQLRSEGDKQGD